MATTRALVGPVSQLDQWLHSCDICIEIAASPVLTNCGHLFCWSCLNGAFQGQHARPCPVCTADLLEETAHGFPGDGSEAPAGPTIEVASSDAAIPNARPPAPARAGLIISNARMDVVQDRLDEEKDHTHAMLLNLSRHTSDMRGDRIRELEQVVENLVQMNLTLLREMEDREQHHRREMEDREQDRRRMNRQIAELENPTVHGPGAFAMRHRRFGRRITPTQIAGENEEPFPEYVEDGLLPSDDDVVGTSRETALNPSVETDRFVYTQSSYNQTSLFPQ